MYIKNSRNSNKIKAFGSNQSLYLTESLVLRNRLLFIYSPLAFIEKRTLKLKKNEKNIFNFYINNFLTSTICS
jgi:hypothetical protein